MNFEISEEKKMEEYDVVVVGAGPAGATLARLLHKNFKVALINGQQEDKPCGGLLAPDAQKSLAGFDLTLPKDVLVDPQIFSVRTMDLRTKQQRWYQRMYMNVDRRKFDCWLLSLVGSSVDIFHEAALEIKMIEDQYHILLKEKQIKANWLVGADGANSFVRRTLGKQLKTKEYVAIQQIFPVEEQWITPFYSCIFDAETSDCCSWTISKDGLLIFGGAFPKRNCRDRFERQKEKLREWGINLDNPIKTQACKVLRPNRFRSFDMGRGRVFYVGEASGLISPSSLEGISSAMNSGRMLADCMNKCREKKQETKIEQRYWNKTRKIRFRLLAKNMKCPFMYWPFLRKVVLGSGISSIHVQMHTTE